MNNRKTGSKYEGMVCEYLTDHGYKVTDRNFHSRYGEIDIIAVKNSYICFIEVKYRKGPESGLPEEAINPSKIKKICRTASYYICSHQQYSGFQVRYDVASVLGNEIRYYENAFDHVE